MNLNELGNGLVWDEKSDSIGSILALDFGTQIASIEDSFGEVLLAHLEDLTFLELIGEINEVSVYNHDVLKTVNGQLFEIELLGNKQNVTLFSLNEDLERTGTADSLHKDDIEEAYSYMSVLGSIYEVELEEDKLDFNIKIVRDTFDEDGIVYYYACNNKEEDEIDLIKVVFIGSQLLKEEDYERVTISYDDYLGALGDGELEEATPQMLMDFVLNGENSSNEEQEQVEDENCISCNLYFCNCDDDEDEIDW